MFGVFIERVDEDGRVAVVMEYDTALQAYRARMEYVAAAKLNGFEARARRVATFLSKPGVKLEVWVDRVSDDLPVA